MFGEHVRIQATGSGGNSAPRQNVAGKNVWTTDDGQKTSEVQETGAPVIVVDTNVIAYLYLQGEHTKDTEAILKSDPEWTAPILWRSEFRNVLASCLRLKILLLEDSIRMIHEAERMMQGREYEVGSENILRLTLESKCSAYDCEFVALAQELKIPFVSSDRRLLKAFPSIAISYADFIKR